MKERKRLKRSFASALVMLLIASFAMVSATFAWYIYNTSIHTTNVHMAAGSSISLQISNSYDGKYGYATVMDAFTGGLNPVSTDRISGGFQRVAGFTDGGGKKSNMLANLFEPSEASDYYKTSLFLKTKANNMPVYLSNIGFEDDDKNNPISTAIRVGIVAHKPGRNQQVTGEYIFEINDQKNTDPSAGYNTFNGVDGHVLDSSRKDGSTVMFTPYNKDNFCLYDSETGEVTFKKNSLPICTVKGDGNGGEGEAVELTIYIWLEGCDRDCTGNLANQTLKNLALSFTGKTDQEKRK